MSRVLRTFNVVITCTQFIFSRLWKFSYLNNASPLPAPSDAASATIYDLPKKDVISGNATNTPSRLVDIGASFSPAPNSPRTNSTSPMLRLIGWNSNQPCMRHHILSHPGTFGVTTPKRQKRTTMPPTSSTSKLRFHYERESSNKGGYLRRDSKTISAYRHVQVRGAL